MPIIVSFFICLVLELCCKDSYFSYYYQTILAISQNLLTFARSKRKRMKDNSEERFPVVDEMGKVVGSATRGECHNGSRLLHPVVHLHVFNSRGEVYLQRRPEWKDIQPGKWDTSVGGHVDFGETPEQALLREVREELGVTDFSPERVGQYVFDSRRERELVYVNRTIYDGPVTPSAEELDGGRFWTLDEIRAAIGQNILTPNFESEFQRFFL
jgi:isopentenyldiphosphate isomerase